MRFKKGFSLTEILIACVLMSVIILAVTSVDITSRRFFGTSANESWIQDEAKIAMEHIVRNIQRGIGDMTNAGVADGTAAPSTTNSRGFYILDAEGDLAASGSRIQVKLDKNGDGRYTGSPNDKIVEYNYSANTIVVTDPDIGTENLAKGIVQDVMFSFTTDAPNRVDVKITVRKDPRPEHPASLDNPETTLTSNIILRAMSTN